MKAALLSPTSKNFRPWEFVVVDDREMLQKLSVSKPHGAGFLAEAALAVAVIADTKRSDVWVEDTSIASMSLLLMAHELSLGACWAQIRKRMHSQGTTASEYVKRILGIPDDYEVACIIGIGYKAEEKPPYDEDTLLYEKVHYGRFGQPWK